MTLFSEVVLCECFCVGPETRGDWWSDFLECWSGALFLKGCVIRAVFWWCILCNGWLVCFCWATTGCNVKFLRGRSLKACWFGKDDFGAFCHGHICEDHVFFYDRVKKTPETGFLRKNHVCCFTDKVLQNWPNFIKLFFLATKVVLEPSRVMSFLFKPTFSKPN